MNHLTLNNLLRIAALSLLAFGLISGAVPALAESANWQQYMPEHIPGGDAAALRTQLSSWQETAQ